MPSDSEPGRPHILLLPSWYPSPTRPHAGIFFQDQARALAAAGARVGVLVPRVASYRAALQHWRTGGGLQAATVQGVNVLERGVLARLPARGQSRQAAFVRAGARLYRDYVARHGRPDVLHAHVALDGGVLGARLAQAHDLPLVITEHSSLYKGDDVAPWQLAAAAAAYRRADRLLAVSEAYRAFLQQRFPLDSGWRYLPNLVEDAFFAVPLAPAPAAACFVAVGALGPKKGFDVLLDAFAVVLAAVPDARLRIVGEGGEHAALVARAQAAGIAAQVRFEGLLSRDALRSALAGATCLVSSSRQETFGVAVAEAQAMGLPVVATRCGGPEYIVAPDTGLLVEPDDAAALAAAMLASLQRSWDRAAIRAHCAARFAAPQVAAQLLAIYREVLLHRAGRPA